MAEEKLNLLSSDPTTIALYRARENAEHEKANIFSSGREEGIKEENSMLHKRYWMC